MVIRVARVGLDEERHDVVAQLREHRHGGDAAHAIAAVDDDLELAPRLLEELQAVRDVGVQDRRFLRAALPHREGVLLDGLAQRLDLIAVERLTEERQLEAVILGRVVAPGDLHATVGLEVLDGPVIHGRRRDADEQRGAAGGGQTLRESVLQDLAVLAVVTADDDAALAGVADVRSNGLAERERHFGGEVRAINAADVVLAENLVSDLHYKPLFTSRSRSSSLSSTLSLLISFLASS